MNLNIIQSETETGNSINKNESKITEIKRISEYSVMYVDVDNTIDTSWVSIDRKYINIDIKYLDLHKKVKIYETKTLSSFKENIRFRVKLGYKNLLYYKQDGKFILNAGKTGVLSAEKLKDSIIYETGSRLNINDIKKLEENAKRISCENALTQTNILNSKKQLKKYTIEVFKTYDNNVNDEDIIVKCE